MSIIPVQKQLHLFLYRPAPTANTVYTSDIRGRVRKNRIMYEDLWAYWTKNVFPCKLLVFFFFKAARFTGTLELEFY